ncbi:MAG: hypothetical protein U0802_03880 [Candidatus Binatia bacterium]
MPQRQTKARKAAPRARTNRTPVKPTAGPPRGQPLPFIDDIRGRRLRWDDPVTMFSGPRPESVLGGLEPAFLLFDSSVMQALRSRAAERGMEYDTLVRMIVREHVEEY